MRFFDIVTLYRPDKDIIIKFFSQNGARPDRKRNAK